MSTFSKSRSFKLLALAVTLALSQNVLAISEWGQCGGIGYSGSAVCDSGLACIVQNEYYSQCQKGSGGGATTAAPTTATEAPVPTTTSPTQPAGSGTQKFQFFGVNESGAEFGEAFPGTLDKDYTWPLPSSIDYFVGKGFNTFRVPFKLERMVPPANGIGGAFDATYASGLDTIVKYATGKGAKVLIEPHNYMIYNGQQITDASSFAKLWTNLANRYKDNSNVIFDLMNEPHDIPATTVAAAMQAAVNAIRDTGATNMIFVEGTAWTGAWSWVSSGNADAFKGFKDPKDNFAFEMHQYLDSDHSGTNAQCQSATIGAESLKAATEWLKANNFKGVIGEIGAGSDDQCITAVKGALSYMQEAGSPWLGAVWWAAGPWWGDYFMSIEPPSGVSINRMLPEALMPFM